MDGNILSPIDQTILTSCQVFISIDITINIRRHMTLTEQRGLFLSLKLLNWYIALHQSPFGSRYEISYLPTFALLTTPLLLSTSKASAGRDDRRPLRCKAFMVRNSLWPLHLKVHRDIDLCNDACYMKSCITLLYESDHYVCHFKSPCGGSGMVQ